MTSYFETVKSFADVPITESGIDTSQFLEASEGLVVMFGLLGVGVFSFVQGSLREDIAGVRRVYDSNPSNGQTLEELASNDAKTRGKHGVESLRGLLRGLLLACRALQHSRANDSEELKTSFQRAYDAILGPHHGFAIRMVASLALKATPSRHTFYSRLAQSDDPTVREKFNIALEKWLESLDTLVAHMSGVFDKEGWGKV